MPASIFFDFKLPNATTWFYFSLLLAVALFFKFARLLSIRNWDVLSLFLLVPGLLLLQEARAPTTDASVRPAEDPTTPAGAGASPAQAHHLRSIAYLWLLCGSGYFLARCLFDLALVRRPALQPNLTPGGLTWLGVALFVCLAFVAVRSPERDADPVGKKSAGMVEMEQQVESAARAVADFDTRVWVAILGHLAIVTGLVLIGRRHFQDAPGGVAAAAFYLLLPYTALFAGQIHHVWPTALLVWAVAFYRWPSVAGVLFGLAAGSAYFPALVVPVWFSFYWRRGAGRFAAFFTLTAGLSLAVTGFILWMQGNLAATLRSALDLSDWQAWKAPTTEGFWQGIHWAYRIPVFIAYLAFVATTLFWPAPKHLAHVLALSAAVLISIQFWYADQGGVYVLWYLPLLLLLVFRPNLAERRPPIIAADTDWLARTGRMLGRFLLRMLSPEPLVRVR
jgi:hypothetical protein